MTDAVLRLIPRPPARWTLLTAFADEVAALRAARALFARRVQPAICEFLDRSSVRCVERATGKSVFPGQAGRAVILLELAGTRSEVDGQKRAVLAWARQHAAAFREARSRAEAEQLWAVRRKCSGAMFELGDAKLNEDIAIPMRQYERFAGFLERLRRESGLPIPTFGHLADGNLHVNIMYPFRQSGRVPRRGSRRAAADGDSGVNGRRHFGRARHRSGEDAVPAAPAPPGAGARHARGEEGARSARHSQSRENVRSVPGVAASAHRGPPAMGSQVTRRSRMRHLGQGKGWRLA